jgi:putative tryptophan/tyrosine transport system substrate-binding protein
MLLLGGAMAAPRVLPAQQKVPVIGYLSSFSPPSNPADRATAFRQGLSETGYVEGQNVSFARFRRK